MTAAIPLDGRIAFVRAWHGDHIRRGAHVKVAGRNARILSARDGMVNVRIWSTGERVTIRPSELVAS